MLVLINGIYEDKMLKASTIILPPGEEYCNSKPSFGHFNYFGGPSSTPLRDSVRLRQHLQNNPDDLIMFFSNLWLDHLLVSFFKLNMNEKVILTFRLLKNLKLYLMAWKTAPQQLLFLWEISYLKVLLTKRWIF